MSGPLRRRLDELERAVEGIKGAGVAGEELLERNRPSVGQPLRVLGRRPRGAFSLLPAEVGTVSG